MSVPNQTPYNIYTANGLTTVFAYQFMIMNAGDIEVSINGTPQTSGYIVQGAGQTGGGQIVFAVPPANGDIVMLLRKLTIKRDTDYQDNGDLLAETINADFDRLWLAMQQAFLSDSLSLKRPLLGGPYNAGGLKIINLQDPTNPQDAATKGWVDLQYTIPIAEAKQAAEESKEARDESREIADKFGDVDGVITAAEAARDAAQLSASDADHDADRAEAAASAAEAVTDVYGTYPDIASGLAATTSGQYFRVPQGTGSQVAFIYYLNSAGTAVAVAELAGLAAIVAEVIARSALIDQLPPAWSKYLAVIKDSNGREAWGIDKINGSPTDHTIALWMQKMEETKVLPVLRNIPGYGLVFTLPDPDGEERFTDLAIRSSDGQFADFVMLRWADRLVPLLQGRLDVATRPTPAGTWKHPSGDYVPYVTDLRTIVGLGSSSTNRSNSTYTAMAGDFGAAYVSMGTEGAIIAQNAAHIGAVPALITVSGGSIPASGGVAVTASNIPSNGINMAMGGTLAGVAGSIAWSNGNTGTFTRSASGTAVTVPDGTPFIPNSSRYRPNEIILESGKNDINQNRDAAYILTMTETIVDWLAPFLSTAVVMGHFNNHAYTTAQKTTLAAVNAGIVSTYGNRAIDQQAWLVSSAIWTQLAAEGVTPTTQDLADQAAGLPPTQLMTAAKDHLTPAAYGYRMKYLVKPKLIELGLYKETN